MKKIKTLFQRDPTDRSRVIPEVTPGLEWALAGEGVLTRKWDGTCCMIRNGVLYKRHERKFRPMDTVRGWHPDPVPEGFIPADTIDEVTGKQPGWLPIGKGTEDQWHVEAAMWLEQQTIKPLLTPDDYPLGRLTLSDGTYELCGPKIQGNPEKLDKHLLIPHGRALIQNVPRNFHSLQDLLSTRDIEGIVFWRDSDNPACDKCKIKKRDFGLKR